MKRIGRPPAQKNRRRVNVYVDEELYSRFQILHFNSLLGKPEFGAFSGLVNLFLKQYLDKRMADNDKKLS